MATAATRSDLWLQQALDPTGERQPFPWQRALLGRLLDGKAPRALDVPTGLGKTTVMAIWLVARAAGAPVPRRLVYVVDRRAVVDQATAEAQRLRSWVNDAPDVRESLGLENTRSLPISTLRGQFVDNREWLEDPSCPAIVLGTVDMIGSRLLFSGYGVSHKMRPYHAGLLGADTLLVLDEAHLVPPFERLVEQVASGADVQARPLGSELASLRLLVPPFQVLSLSATGRVRKDDEVLRLTLADERHATVAQRLSAMKQLSLRDEVSDKELPEVLAREAWALSNQGTLPTRVIVFCTSRDHAQKVLEALNKLGREAAIDTELFVGGRRTYERASAARWLEERGFIAGSQGTPQRATFVIATAAGEVGVDLDADHAVCDLVAWERMVQRLGRVNRRGTGEAQVVVVSAATEDEKERSRRAAIHTLLTALPNRDGASDVSPGALTRLKAEHAETIEQASSQPLLHPPLTRPVLESWSMTSLDDHTGRPEVSPWIRGWLEEPEEPQTTVVWRRHLPVTEQGQLLGAADLETFRDAADPHLAEHLEVETWRVVEWLSARLKRLDDTGAPKDGEPHERPLRSTDVVAVILDPFVGQARTLAGDALSTGEKRKAVNVALRGATLLLDSRVRGLSSGLLTRDGDGDPEERMDLTQMLPEAETGVPFRTRVVEGDVPDSRRGWRTEAAIALARSDAGVTRWLVIDSDLRKAAESEEGRSGAQRSQELEAHQTWTEEEARRLAGRLRLPPEYAEFLAVAARLHDEGKQAERWQRAFGVTNGPPLAKTTGRPNLQLLEGYRHEFGSLPHAEAHPRVKALSPELRELCLHVIAAHHGRARPIIPTSGAPEPPSQLVQRAQDVALRFAMLERRWGPWGLAWWEALLRAADQRASRRNDEEDGSRG